MGHVSDNEDDEPRVAVITRDTDLRWFRAFATSSRWRFAKTYVESYPHEYTLDEWCDEESFQKAIHCIERWGTIEPFWTARRKYLYVDDRKYWHMGDPSSDNVEDHPGLINRSWVDVSRYRGDAKRLGYDEAGADGLVERWKNLLKKAGQPQL